MPNNTNTAPHANAETAYVTVQLTPGDIEPNDWTFLQEWSNRLNVTLEDLLQRILVAATMGQLHVERIPEV